MIAAAGKAIAPFEHADASYAAGTQALAAAKPALSLFG